MAFSIFQKIKRNILVPLKLIPNKGLSNEKISLSITIGIVTGMFPVIGGTTVIGLVMLAVLRQNLAIVQAINWIIAPVQLILIIPFMRLGAEILQQHPVQITLKQIVAAFEPGYWEGIKNLSLLHLYGVIGWILLALPVSFLLYYFLLFCRFI